jgi:predicted metal-binding protein
MMNMPFAPPDVSQDSVSICRTCPRYLHESGAFAMIFGEGMRAALHKRGVPLLMVTCLGSCKQPGAIALDSPWKDRLRFSRLNADDIEMLICAVDTYRAAPAGRIDLDKLPPTLRSRLSAVSPKSRLNGACAPAGVAKEPSCPLVSASTPSI